MPLSRSLSLSFPMSLFHHRAASRYLGGERGREREIEIDQTLSSLTHSLEPESVNVNETESARRGHMRTKRNYL